MLNGDQAPFPLDIIITGHKHPVEYYVASCVSDAFYAHRPLEYYAVSCARGIFSSTTRNLRAVLPARHTPPSVKSMYDNFKRRPCTTK